MDAIFHDDNRDHRVDEWPLNGPVQKMKMPRAYLTAGLAIYWVQPMEFIKLEDMIQVSWQFQKVCQTIELTYEIFSQVSRHGSF